MSEEAEKMAERLEAVSHLACFGAWIDEKVERMQSTRDAASLIRSQAERIRVLEEVARDAAKALPVLKTLLESAGLAAGVIVAEGMIAQTRAAMEPRNG